MQLTDKEIRMIGRRRLSHNKKVNWNMKWVIPTYLSGLAAIGLMSYWAATTSDKNFSSSSFTSVFWVAIGLLFVMLLLEVIWTIKVRDPYLKKYVAYYKEHNELME